MSYTQHKIITMVIIYKTIFISIHKVGIDISTYSSFKTKNQVVQACQWDNAPLQAMVQPIAKNPK